MGELDVSTSIQGTEMTTMNPTATVPISRAADTTTDISFSKLIVDIVQATDLPSECDAYAVIHFQVEKETAYMSP
jgi:flavin-binding protein dodecin